MIPNNKELNIISHRITIQPRFQPYLVKLTCLHLAHMLFMNQDWFLFFFSLFWADPFLIVQPIGRVVNGWITCLNALNSFPPSAPRNIEPAVLLPDLQWEGTAALGPILLEGDIGEEELTEPPELLPEPASLLQTHEVTWAGETALVVSTRGSAPMEKSFQIHFFSANTNA